MTAHLRPGSVVSIILLTDGEQRSTLAVTRSLGRAGHRVWVGSGGRRSLAGASRYAAGKVILEAVTGEPGVYRDSVRRAVKRTGAEILIPMTDAAASQLLGLDRELPGLLVPFPERAIYEAISDKGRVADVAASLGIAVPRQTVVTSPHPGAGTALPSSLGEPATYPKVLKPTRSVTVGEDGAEAVLATTVRTAGNAEELARHLEAYPPESYPILIQQQIVGPGAGVFLLRWEGRSVAAFAHRRIRERPPEGGVSVYRESVSLAPSLLRRAEALLDAFDFRGVAMVEFKEDETTGTPYVMEVNARFWGSLQLAVDAGVDFPRLLVDVASGAPVEPVLRWRTGIRSRWLWGEVDHLLAVLRAGPATRRRHPDYPRRLPTLARVLVPWRPGDRYEVLRPGDPGPFLRETVEWFGALGR